MKMQRSSIILAAALLAVAVPQHAGAGPARGDAVARSPAWTQIKQSNVHRIAPRLHAGESRSLSSFGRDGTEATLIVSRNAPPGPLSDPAVLKQVEIGYDATKAHFALRFDGPDSGYMTSTSNRTTFAVRVSAVRPPGEHGARNLAKVANSSWSEAPYQLHLGADYSVEVAFHDGTKRMFTDAQIHQLPPSQTRRPAKLPESHVAMR